MQLYIVLFVTLLMIVGFVTGKYKYGLITMTCCAILALTGVMDIQTAFSGLSNKTVILIAAVLALSYALGKTSLVDMVQAKMELVRGKSGFALVSLIFLVSIVLSQFMTKTATIAIVVLFLQSLNNDDEVTPSRLLLPILGLLEVWFFKFPFGPGASQAQTINGLYAKIVNNDAVMLQVMDLVKVSILPMIVSLIFALFAWKLLPKHSIDTSGVKEQGSHQVLPKGKQITVLVVFFLVILAFIFGAKFGDLMYVAPVIGVLLLVYAKCLTVDEVVRSVTSDMTWMIAGVLTVSAAMTKVGIGEYIGTFVQQILGEHPSGYFVLFVFGVAAIVMTTFMSNMGTAAILTPIAANLAVVSGMDPRGLALMIYLASCMALAFPSGSADGALTYSIGKYNPAKVLVYTIPFLLLVLVALMINIEMVFPIFPK